MIIFERNYFCTCFIIGFSVYSPDVTTLERRYSPLKVIITIVILWRVALFCKSLYQSVDALLHFCIKPYRLYGKLSYHSSDFQDTIPILNSSICPPYSVLLVIMPYYVSLKFSNFLVLSDLRELK